MLTKEMPSDGRRRRRGGPVKGPVAVLLVLAVVGVLVMRNDFWQWKTPYPLLFGFLPVGLWWQALVSISAAAVMWLLVTFAWPERLEDEAERAVAEPQKHGGAERAQKK